MHDNGADFVRGVAALHAKSPFGFAMLAANVGVRASALEDFIVGKQALPLESLQQLVEALFHNRAAWDPAAETLVDVAPAPTPMMDMRDLPAAT
jgi:hypothetical protein